MSAPRRRDGLLSQPWTLAFAIVSVVLVVLHIYDLAASPPGLYSDEASIGYNAWAVAHHGIDEHGHNLPLFFEAFGEYKNPVYIYALAPFTWVLPLSAAVVRLPAALFGLAACAAAAMLAWEITRSRLVAMLALLTAGLTPWLVQQSRIGFEVISLVALVMLALWFMARGDRTDSRRWFLAAGVAAALSVIAYSTGRVFGVMFAVVIAVSYLIPSQRRVRRWMWVLPPLVAMYGGLLFYNSRNPGALTARFSAISIGWDSPGVPTLIGRFMSNYVTYWGFPFLATHGDPNPRHSTGFGGLMLVTSIPAIVLGAAVCVRRIRSDAFCRVLVLGALVAPVPASITAEATPHSLRAVLMLPFLLGFAVYGWQVIAPALHDRRLIAAAAAAAVAVEAGAFYYDLYVQYPGRVLGYFDTGEGDAIVAASRLAGGHEVFLSSSLDGPYIHALFELRPDPRLYVRDGLRTLHMRIADVDMIGSDAQPGDLMVLTPSDAVPQGAHVVLVEQELVGNGPAEIDAPDTRLVDLAVVAQR